MPELHYNNMNHHAFQQQLHLLADSLIPADPNVHVEPILLVEVRKIFSGKVKKQLM